MAVSFKDFERHAKFRTEQMLMSCLR